MTARQNMRCRLFVRMALILATWWCVDSGAEEPGRLFTTPEERDLLEKLRNLPSAVSERTLLADDREKAHEKPESGDITVNGFVYRRSGRSTVWLNNVSLLLDGADIQHLSAMDGDIDDSDVFITIPDSGMVIRLQDKEMHHGQAEQ